MRIFSGLLAAVGPVALIAAAVACGTDKSNDKDSGGGTQAPSNVRSCQKATGSLALQGQSVSYTTHLYPLMQRSCARCHAGDIENRKNSTNCYYLKDNLANVLKRFENALDAQADRAAQPDTTLLTNDQILGQYAQTERPMPQFPFRNDTPALTTAEIQLFRDWADVPDDQKCVSADAPPELAEIPAVDAYSDAEAGGLPSTADVAICEDGPKVNDEGNWALIKDTIAAEPEAPSAFYNYSTKEYTEGATAAPFECNWDNFLSSLNGVAGVAETLGPYRDYGWRLIQCTVVNGLPMAGMATLAKLTDADGDTSLALTYKTITIDPGK